MFAFAKQDDFILPHHSEELFNLYAGDKTIKSFDGDHNSSRPSFFFDSAIIFMYQRLQVDTLLREDNKIKKGANKVTIVNKTINLSGQLNQIGFNKGDKMSYNEDDYDPAIFNAEFDLIKHISDSQKIMGA
jgi:hypothetical protein